MAYIKNQRHFFNYLSNLLADASISPEKCAPKEFYLEHIYNAGLADSFTWDVRNDPSTATKDGVLKWLKDNSNFYFTHQSQFDHNFTTEFVELIEDLAGLPGVYSFWRKQEVLYVGMSINLGQRIPTSFKRFDSLDTKISLKYIRTKTVSDAALLEIYYISTLQPPLNSEVHTKDELTLEIKNIPTFSNLTVCNTVERGETDD